MINSLKRVTDTDKFFIDLILKEGDIAVDLTCGKGNDTIYLSNKVGQKGKVYSFDIQTEAIKATKEKVDKDNIGNVTLIQDNHLNFDKYLKDNKVSVFMLNLGYLPGENKTIKTEPKNTIKVIEKCLTYLKDNGIITICIYPHTEGKEENKEILKLVKTLTGSFNAYEFKRLNRNDPPYLVLITKD